MKTISRTEILDEIQQNSNVNFVAYVITPWHAISLNALLLFYRSKGIRLQGIVLIYPHNETGIHLSEKDFAMDGVEVYSTFDWGGVYTKDDMGEMTFFTKKLHNLKKKVQFYYHAILGGVNIKRKQNFYLMAPVFPMVGIGAEILKLNKHIKYVALDEGVGTYLDNMEETFPTIRSIRDIKCLKNYWRDIVVTNHILPICHKMQNAYLFYRKKTCYVNQEIAPFYRQALASHVNHCQLDIDLTNSIVICTSVVFNNIFQNQEDVRMWTCLCNKLYFAGYNLVLKPHPRDTFFAGFADSWHCKLLNTNLSMEDICTHTHPLAIFSIHSTTLITVSALWGISTFCVADLFNKTNVNDNFIEEVNKYKNLFATLISFPTDLDDCIKQLNNITHEK